jgi:prevent-host-death family protein
MANKTVEVEEAKEKLKELIELVGEGTEVVLTDGRVPLARLVPVAPAATQRIAGLHPGIATTTPDFDDPLPDDFWSSE